jgi:mRNA interferase HigB
MGVHEKTNYNYQFGNYYYIFVVTNSGLEVRVVAKKILREYWEKQIDAEGQLKTWYKETSKAKWNSPADIKTEYPRASILKSGRVVFNICGNKYSLIVMINYLRKWVFIRFIGTHKEYNMIDADKI